MKSLVSALLAGMMSVGMVFASGRMCVQVEEVTDKPGYDFVFENESQMTKYLDLDQRLQVYREWFGKEPSADATMGEWEEVHVINPNTTFHINYANSANSEENVEGVYLMLFQWYKDADGKIRSRKARWSYYKEDENGELQEVWDSEFAYREWLYFETDGYDGDDAPKDTNGTFAKPRRIYDGYVTFLAEAVEGKNHGVGTWNRPVSEWSVCADLSGHIDSGTAYESLKDVADVNIDKCFLGIACVDYYNEEADSTWCEWRYFVPENALTDPDNPFTFVDKKPEGNETSSSDGACEVTLESGKETVTKEKFAELLTENAAKDVVVKNAQGVTFTFAKGTMKAVDGMEAYDFSAQISSDYEANKTLPTVTKDNFVLKIDYAYSGQLPAEAAIKIPVGTAYAGKTLYYSRYDSSRGFNLVSSGKVDDSGYLTVRQDRCSAYVISTEELKANASGTEDKTEPEAAATAEGSSAMSSVVKLMIAAGVVVVVLMAGVVAIVLAVCAKNKKQ